MLSLSQFFNRFWHICQSRHREKWHPRPDGVWLTGAGLPTGLSQRDCCSQHRYSADYYVEKHLLMPNMKWIFITVDEERERKRDWLNKAICSPTLTALTHSWWISSQWHRSECQLLTCQEFVLLIFPVISQHRHSQALQQQLWYFGENWSGECLFLGFSKKVELGMARLEGPAESLFLSGETHGKWPLHLGFHC